MKELTPSEKAKIAGYDSLADLCRKTGKKYNTVRRWGDKKGYMLDKLIERAREENK